MRCVHPGTERREERQRPIQAAVRVAGNEHGSSPRTTWIARVAEEAKSVAWCSFIISTCGEFSPGAAAFWLSPSCISIYSWLRTRKTGHLAKVHSQMHNLVKCIFLCALPLIYRHFLPLWMRARDELNVRWSGWFHFIVLAAYFYSQTSIHRKKPTYIVDIVNDM